MRHPPQHRLLSGFLWREMPTGGIRPHARPGFLQQRPARHQYFPIVDNITGEGKVQWRVGGVNGGFGGGANGMAVVIDKHYYVSHGFH